MKKNLEPTTLKFIRDLRENNQREWFVQHRDRYEAARQDFISFLESILLGAVSFEPGLEDLAAKDLMFRIYRDVRFSNDKRPYKDHICAYLAEGGRKTIYPGYYLHICPSNQSYIAGGVWMPPAPALKAIRQEIDYNFTELQDLLANPAFVKHFTSVQGDKLKTTPKGYDPDNPAIDLLRHKSWVFTVPLPDDIVTSDALYETVLSVMQAVKPLNDFFHRPMKELLQQEA